LLSLLLSIAATNAQTCTGNNAGVVAIKQAEVLIKQVMTEAAPLITAVQARAAVRYTLERSTFERYTL
jgi:hypothetical protein